MKNTINFKKPKVLFFEINETILDLNLLRTEINNLFGQDIFDLWFAKLLHKSLMFTITGNFESFTQIGKSSVSCPLKPSDSAPLKHSTMPP